MNSSVSVVIPTHNRSRLVARAILSVLAAILPGDEVVVVDDGSTDDTSEVVQRFGDPVRYVRIENSGPGAARNVGIQASRNPFVGFVDSDDRWLPDKLELQRKVMEAFPSAVFCFGTLRAALPGGGIEHDLVHSEWQHHHRIGADSARRVPDVLGPGVRYSSIARLPEGRADFNVHLGDLYPAEMEAHYVCSDAVLVRRDLAGALLRYPEDIRIMEDYACFARLSRVGPAAYLDAELADVTVHEGSRLTDLHDIEQLAVRIELLQRLWGDDDAFLQGHADRYRRVLASKVNLRARMLIGAGRLAEARACLRTSGGRLSYRLVASLPPALVNSVLQVKRGLRRMLA